jgi:DNA-binding beta-propeller fold protein YncE
MNKPTLRHSRATVCLLASVVGAGAMIACSSGGGSSHDNESGGRATADAGQMKTEGDAASSSGLGTLTAAANDPSVLSPFDATPDPTGTTIYFTALGSKGAGVFKVPAKGGAIYEVFSGSPFVSPFSIAISADGKTLFVADVGASNDTSDVGMIFSLPVGGGTPSDIGTTDGMVPRGVEVSGNTLYFTGATTKGVPGVFSMPVGGGSVTPLATGAPFHDPSGVAISSKGDVYVVDTSSRGSTSAQIVKVTASGSTSVFLAGISVGFPAGIVMNQAESELLVSAIDQTSGTDAVLVIDVASTKVSEFTTGISKFIEPAGLHRAHGADIFAWADSKAQETGTVYVISK